MAPCVIQNIRQSLNSFIPNWFGPWPPSCLTGITLFFIGCIKLHVALQTLQGLPPGLCSCCYLCVEYFTPGLSYDFPQFLFRLLFKENSMTTLSEITAPGLNIIIPNFLNLCIYLFFLEFVVSETYTSKNFLPPSSEHKYVSVDHVSFVHRCNHETQNISQSILSTQKKKKMLSNEYISKSVIIPRCLPLQNRGRYERTVMFKFIPPYMNSTSLAISCILKSLEKQQPHNKI